MPTFWLKLISPTRVGAGLCKSQRYCTSADKSAGPRDVFIVRAQGVDNTLATNELMDRHHLSAAKNGITMTIAAAVFIIINKFGTKLLHRMPNLMYRLEKRPNTKSH
jgi:hypothetical protein